MFPSESQVTSVGWRNSPSIAGRGGLTCSQGLAPSAAEHPNYATCLIEFDNHVGTLVDGPDVVVLVDAHTVSFGPGVKAFANFTQELAFRTELQQLRRCRTISGASGAIGTREDEDMALGINGHARNLTEIHPGRQLWEIRDGIVGDFRHVLLSEGQLSQQSETR